MGTEAANAVTISFMGGAMVPGLPKKLTLDLAEPTTVLALLERLEQVIGIPDLRAKLMLYYIIVLDGMAIQHLNACETLVSPGSELAVLAPMGGGGSAV